MVFIIIVIIIILLLIIINNKKQHFKEKHKKLAFCFMIYDKINHEELWYNFFKNIEKSKYSIYIHHKTDEPLKYFEDYKLKNTIDTNWCDESLVKAQNLLLQEAVKDKDNTNFIFVSGSCVPLKSFKHIYNNLKLGKSYFNKADVDFNFNNFDKGIRLYKASQWCILNKKHTMKILENKKLINNIITSLGKIHQNYCPDEYVYLSLLYFLNLKNELIETPNLSTDATTFTGWHNMSNYKNFRKSKKQGYPNNYSYICPEELAFIASSKSFFGRKFDNDCKGLDKLKKIF
tara:strand:- start:1118 stop:1984 length:867 start_codon:yes stop_codon:yes gene_type:complete